MKRFYFAALFTLHLSNRCGPVGWVWTMNFEWIWILITRIGRTIFQSISNFDVPRVRYAGKWTISNGSMKNEVLFWVWRCFVKWFSTRRKCKEKCSTRIVEIHKIVKCLPSSNRGEPIYHSLVATCLTYSHCPVSVRLYSPLALRKFFFRRETLAICLTS